jgi:hypothetical protein
VQVEIEAILHLDSWKVMSKKAMARTKLRN